MFVPNFQVSAYKAESLVGLVCDGGDVIAPFEDFLYLNSKVLDCWYILKLLAMELV